MHLRLHSVLAGEWGFEPRQPGSSVLGLKLFGLGPEVNCPVLRLLSLDFLGFVGIDPQANVRKLMECGSIL